MSAFLFHPCPECGARSGQPCHEAVGGASGLHRRRVEDAEEIPPSLGRRRTRGVMSLEPQDDEDRRWPTRPGGIVVPGGGG